ncbi:hypothetical protein HMPREF7215_1453 [Pyramidobacter piscolens W5455]|uniref:Uncharacterized protein n=1 Tax=Pyramidobacter piscolens W5455 TaxID=352165 RepID=A0ABM9ZSH2_9BACT|nr:hypothetical protein HMPREF7215_1453 [Pyramidobacter piscolens W5455]
MVSLPSAERIFQLRRRAAARPAVDIRLYYRICAAKEQRARRPGADGFKKHSFAFLIYLLCPAEFALY